MPLLAAIKGRRGASGFGFASTAGEVTEVITATNPNVEGEATALYVAKLLQPLGLPITRIAQGLPAGTSLDHVDELTMARALQGRRPT